MEDLIPVLTRFHRDILLPDIERIVGASEQRLRNEMHTLFDSLSCQIEELRTEYHMPVEERVSSGTFLAASPTPGSQRERM